MVGVGCGIHSNLVPVVQVGGVERPPPARAARWRKMRDASFVDGCNQPSVAVPCAPASDGSFLARACRVIITVSKLGRAAELAPDYPSSSLSFPALPSFSLAPSLICTHPDRTRSSAIHSLD